MAKDTGAKDNKKKSAGPRPQSARLEDDTDLWARVAETAEPLSSRNRFVDVEMRKHLKPAPKKPAPAGPAKTMKPSPVSPEKITVRPAPSPKTGLDRTTHRKLTKGHLAIEARIDLHGMRQREAHTALRKFLHWARGKDYRHVLVITGKGSTPSEGRSFYEEEVRGILRQQVPHWLSHGDLAPMIVSFSEAPQRLGGGGALYVRLRKTR